MNLKKKKASSTSSENRIANVQNVQFTMSSRLSCYTFVHFSETKKRVAHADFLRTSYERDNWMQFLTSKRHSPCECETVACANAYSLIHTISKGNLF